MSECLHPRHIKNPLFRQVFHSKDGKPDFSRRVLPGENNQDMYLLVPCGKCLNCRTNRQNDWAFRLEQENLATVKSGGVSYFITFTYTDENLKYGSDQATLYKRDVQLFHKRLRKAGLQFRYFTIGEYGGKLGRPHYHGMYFFPEYHTPEELHEIMYRCWNMCEPERFTLDPFNIQDAKYIAKYSLKSPFVDSSGLQPPFSISSKKPSIGASFLSSQAAVQVVVNQSYKVFDTSGTPYNLPRYYKQRLFSPLERKNIVSSWRDEDYLHKLQIYPDSHTMAIFEIRTYMEKLNDEYYKVRQKSIEEIGHDCRVTIEDYLKIFVK